MGSNFLQDTLPVQEIKVVLLGACGVGKTCLAESFVNGNIGLTTPTIGAAYMKRTFTAPNGVFEFQLWDTAGQEKYRSLAPMYYRDTRAVVIVFDLTSASSFDSAKLWVKEFRISGPDHAVMILAGNKSDLESERAVQSDVASAYAQEISAFYVETSAVTNVNIEKVFLTIAENVQEVSPRRSYSIPNQRPKGHAGNGQSTIDINTQSQPPRARKNCC